MKVIVEDVIVKDYLHQGLAVFDPVDPANPGFICGWGTMLSYERGERPDMESAPMCYGECEMPYFYRGHKPRADDPRVEAFLERYREWAEPAYQNLADEPIKLVLRRVFKDQYRYRRVRWKELGAQ